MSKTNVASSDFEWNPDSVQLINSSAVESRNFSTSVANTKFTWRINLSIKRGTDIHFCLRLINRNDNCKGLPENTLVKIEMKLRINYSSEIQIYNCYAENVNRDGILQCWIPNVLPPPFDVKSATQNKSTIQNMSIKCTLLFLDSSSTNPVYLNTASTRLFDNIISQNPSDTFADVAITCSDGNTFRVHSCFLADSSPVFRRMLENVGFKEGKERQITIPDIDSKTMIEILRYIYTDTMTDALKPLASNVLDAVEKYNLPDPLKIRCHQHLQQTLSLTTAIDFLLLADTYKLKELKVTATEMIVKNLDKIRTQDVWKQLLSKRADLVDELFAATGPKTKVHKNVVKM